MATNTIPSIETLPVEIFHRIFDNLNAQTILFSIRSVDRLFRAVVSTYGRFSFDFKSISQSDFHLLCRLVNPQNVISLTLCNNDHTPNQLALFITLVRLRQFTRLHSVTFLGIDEVQFNKFLKSISVDSLTSFSLNIQNYDNRRKKTTSNLLSSIMSQKCLRKLELGINNDRLASVSWPLNCTIEYLIINENITYDNIYNMLVSFVQLHTLIIKQNFSIAKNIIVTNSFPKLTSLTIEKLNTTVDNFESFLSMTPSLIKLKILGEGWILNGKQWEQIIQIHLPHLHNFQFSVSDNKPRAQTRDDLQLIIETFQSSFWTEHKKWFVACDFVRDRPHKIQLYSIPICKYVDRYEVSSEKVFISNSTIKFHNDPLITNNINKLILPLKETTTGYLDKGVCYIFIICILMK
ncbi:unnamed protein product [Rotaria sordida]|uniref:F-box domain-containing protein n=1 Tax=Rotaria sordida TaxID=392033 RepID=A0A819F0U4_9BILA|nr:unnamed protein product [Rotaria sordida]